MAVGCEEQLCGAHRKFISSGHERISEDEVDMEDREIAVPVYVKAGTRKEVLRLHSGDMNSRTIR